MMKKRRKPCEAAKYARKFLNAVNNLHPPKASIHQTQVQRHNRALQIGTESQYRHEIARIC
jgi:hypothetical protein